MAEGNRSIQFDFIANTASLLLGISKAKEGMAGLKKFIAAEAVIEGFTQVARAAVTFNQNLLELRRGFNFSSQDMMRYKATLEDVSMSSGASADELQELSKGVLNHTHDINGLSASLKDIATGFEATGGNAKEFGDFIGTAMHELKLGPEALKTFMAGLNTIGHSEGMRKNFQQILGSGNEIIEAAKKYYGENLTSKEVQEFAAMSMVGGDPAAVVKLSTRLLTNQARQKAGKFGISLFNPDGTKKDVEDVLKQIVKVTGGNKNKIEDIVSTIWGRGSTDILKIIAGIQDVDKALAESNAKGGWAEMQKQAAVASGSLGGALNKVHGMFTFLSNALMTQALDNLATSIGKIDPEEIKVIGEAFSVAGKALGETVKLLAFAISGYGQLIGLAKEWADEAKTEERLNKSAQNAADALKWHRLASGAPGQLPGQGAASSSSIPTNVSGRNSIAAMGGDAQSIANSMFQGHEGMQDVNVFVQLDSERLPVKSKVTFGNSGSFGAQPMPTDNAR